MPADWNKIRLEYITDGTTSYRKLAKKYGIPQGTLAEHAVKEGWVEQRNQSQNKTVRKMEEALLVGAEKDAENILKARSVLTMRALEMAATATRASDIINLTNALQILARMTGVQSDLDTAEQKARIASIEARSQVQEESEEAGVFILTPKWKEESDE